MWCESCSLCCNFSKHGDSSQTPYEGACGQCWSYLVGKQQFLWQKDQAHSISTIVENAPLVSMMLCPNKKSQLYIALIL